MQIDLGDIYVVTGVVTRGRRSNTLAQWVTSYNVSTSVDGILFDMVKNGGKAFTGNSDQNTRVRHDFQRAVPTARFVRFTVETWHIHISMRAAVYVARNAREPCETDPATGFSPVCLVEGTDTFSQFYC